MRTRVYAKSVRKKRKYCLFKAIPRLFATARRALFEIHAALEIGKLIVAYGLEFAHHFFKRLIFGRGGGKVFCGRSGRCIRFGGTLLLKFFNRKTYLTLLVNGNDLCFDLVSHLKKIMHVLDI